ncbi:MAG: dual specificity protein phosphatase 23 [Planctomycetota bacterium]
MPRSFSWLIKGEIAGMGRPLDLRKDLEFLQDEGVGGIVSLTETPLQQALIDEFGMEYRHIPIADFTAPEPWQIDEFVAFVKQVVRRNRPVVIHCFAGKGRTGTMLACYLVSKGRSAEDAIAEVRRARPGSIETASQEDAVESYAQRLKRKRRRR